MTAEHTLCGRFSIQKSSDEKRLAFGWASISQDESGAELVDLAEFVRLYREGGEMHERGDCAVLVESVVFTKEKMAAMGIPEGTLPTGWGIGFYITDDEVWEKVKSGEYPMFSIEGTAIPETV